MKKSYFKNSLNKLQLFVKMATASTLVAVGYFVKKFYEISNVPDVAEQYKMIWMLCGITVLALIIIILFIKKTEKIVAGEIPLEKIAPYHEQFTNFAQILKKNNYDTYTVEKLFLMSNLAKEYFELDKSNRYFINQSNDIEKKFFAFHKEVYREFMSNPPKFSESKNVEEKQVEDIMNTFFFTLGEIDKKEMDVFQIEKKDNKTLKASM